MAVGDDGDGQIDVTSWKNVVSVATGTYHTVALDRSGEALETGARGSHILVMPG